MKFRLPIMGLMVLLAACNEKRPIEHNAATSSDSIAPVKMVREQFFTDTFQKDVLMKNYFHVMDSLVARYDTIYNWPITEHLLIRTNPWVIDTLANTDYYTQKARGIFIEDQKEMVILPKGSVLMIPDSLMSDSISERLKNTVIDVNIPEFNLRIMEYGKTIKECKVRVGRNDKQYMKTAGREADLRTVTGIGSIVRIARDPYYVNPTTGKRYYATRRDDGKYTKMPQIPWLEPELDGMLPGDLIHPTTNPETLGKPCSHGCVGCSETDAWYVYYSAPIGTKVIFRYDLEVITSKGDTIELPDIYNKKKRPKKNAN
ncbi:MAG: L,D-transpeptidase family protein [Flavobacteriales bacterium]|nr:L,D-transpeptidase family protein [Flavobacteriales bacterium]